MGNTKFAYIFDGIDNEHLGDVCLFEDGSACVRNDWSDITQWFDNPATGRDDAMNYIKSRMTDNPKFVVVV